MCGSSYLPSSHTFLEEIIKKKILHWNQKCFQQDFRLLLNLSCFNSSICYRKFKTLLSYQLKKAVKDKITKNNHFHFVYRKRVLVLLSRSQGGAKIWQKLFASRALKSFVRRKTCSRAAKSIISVHHAENRCICNVR